MDIDSFATPCASFTRAVSHPLFVCACTQSIEILNADYDDSHSWACLIEGSTAGDALS